MPICCREAPFQLRNIAITPNVLNISRSQHVSVVGLDPAGPRAGGSAQDIYGGSGGGERDLVHWDGYVGEQPRCRWRAGRLPDGAAGMICVEDLSNPRGAAMHFVRRCQREHVRDGQGNGRRRRRRRDTERDDLGLVNGSRKEDGARPTGEQRTRGRGGM